MGALLDIDEIAMPGTLGPGLDLDLIEQFPDIDSEDDSSDSEEDLEGKLMKRERNRTDTEKINQRQKLLNVVAPGVNLFCSEYDENGFLYFSMDSLDLERDFGYSRRGKLMGHGFTSEQLDLILRDRGQFVRHLFPEAQSVLICDKSDFRAVMNFLFFSISVCCDRRLNDLMTKAFFDLRKNYGFRWGLSLNNILAVLLNYGAAEEVVFNERFLNKDNVGIKKHLEEVRKSGQKAPEKYQFPKLPGFFTKRRKMGDKSPHYRTISPKEFSFCVSRLIVLVSDFSAGLPTFLEFRYRNNWTEQIVFLYLLMVLGTDKRFITDHRVKESVISALHFHLDSFSSEQWFWGPTLRPANDQSKEQGFNHSNVCKTLIRLVNEFFPGELCPSLICWKDVRPAGGPQVTNREENSDHHLNMLHRIHLLPPSFRGNQVKKYLAYMYLQTLAEINFSLPTHVDVVELTDHPSLCDKLSDGLKMIVLSKNFELITTIVELYDIIVGHEPEYDFSPDKVPHVERLKLCVLGWVRKKMPGMGQHRELSDEQFVKGMQLVEYLDIVDGRWETHIKRNKRF